MAYTCFIITKRKKPYLIHLGQDCCILTFGANLILSQSQLARFQSILCASLGTTSSGNSVQVFNKALTQSSLKFIKVLLDGYLDT